MLNRMKWMPNGLPVKKNQPVCIAVMHDICIFAEGFIVYMRLSG